MLGESTRCLSPTVETRNDCAPQVNHLRLAVDPQAGNTIMDAGSRPRRVERRRLNLVLRRRLSEVRIFPLVYKGVVPGHRLLQCAGGYGLLLILADNPAGQFRQRIPAEKPAVGIDEWRRTNPTLAFRSIRIKDSPDGPASLRLSAVQLQAGIPPIESSCRLIHESSPHLIHLDEVLEIRYLQANRAGKPCDWTILQVFIAASSALRVAVAVSNHVGFLKNMRSRLRFHRLVCRAPKRCADLHGGDFSIAGLARVGFTHHLVLFGESGVENSAEVHIARVAACAEDHALFRLDVQGFSLVGCRESENLS